MNLSKIVIGNAVFAAIIWAYYLYVGGNRTRFLEGVLLAGLAFATGALVGASLRERRQRRSLRRGPAISDEVFDQIT